MPFLPFQPALSPLHGAAKRSQWYSVQRSQSSLPRLLVTIHLGSLGKMPAVAMGKKPGRCSLPLSPDTCEERERRNQLCHGRKTDSRYHLASSDLTTLSLTRKHWAKLYRELCLTRRNSCGCINSQKYISGIHTTTTKPTRP